MDAEPIAPMMLGMIRPAAIRASYDKIAERYAQARDGAASLAALERMNAALAPDSLVLDLGCGAGLPVDRWLVDAGHRVVGLDISEAMLVLARANVPEATYRQGDIAALLPSQFSVDAVVCFFALFHIDRGLHRQAVRTIRSFLAPGGLLTLTTGRDAWEGREPFLGVDMRWSHFDRETYRRLLVETGFEILLEDEHRGNAIEDDAPHPVFIARAV